MSDSFCFHMAHNNNFPLKIWKLFSLCLWGDGISVAATRILIQHLPNVMNGVCYVGVSMQQHIRYLVVRCSMTEPFAKILHPLSLYCLYYYFYYYITKYYHEYIEIMSQYRVAIGKMHIMSKHIISNLMVMLSIIVTLLLTTYWWWFYRTLISFISVQVNYGIVKVRQSLLWQIPVTLCPSALLNVTN